MDDPRIVLQKKIIWPASRPRSHDWQYVPAACMAIHHLLPCLHETLIGRLKWGSTSLCLSVSLSLRTKNHPCPRVAVLNILSKEAVEVLSLLWKYSRWAKSIHKRDSDVHCNFPFYFHALCYLFCELIENTFYASVHLSVQQYYAEVAWWPAQSEFDSRPDYKLSDWWFIGGALHHNMHPPSVVHKAASLICSL